MRCEECREALSARLDGEARADEAAPVDRHLAGCAACRRFAEAAARVTRLARTGPVEPIPDLLGSVRHVISTPRRLRLRTGLRAALALVGVGQLALATADLVAVTAHPGGDQGTNGVSLTHFSHESSAWNLALAVGFLCVAARPARSRGMVPLVGAFVAALTGLSLVDLAQHRVAESRLASHAFVVLGLGAMLALARVRRHPGGGVPGAVTDPDGEVDEDNELLAALRSATSLTGSDEDHGLKPTARHAA